MKKRNLFLATAIALSTVMAPMAGVVQSLPVIAADPQTKLTLTIENVPADRDYALYQVFKGSNIPNALTNSDDTLVLGDIEWGDNVKSTELLAAVNEKLNLTGDNALKTAQEVAEKLNDKTLTADDFADLVSQNLGNEIDANNEADDDTKVQTYSNLTAGYYFAKDRQTKLAAPSKFMLKVVTSKTVSAKATSVPDHEKKVTENVQTVTGDATLLHTPGDKVNDVADYNIGDTIPFQLAAVVPDTSEFKNYELVFKDDADEGLTIDPTSIKVYVNDSESALESDKYSIKTENIDGDDFHVTVEVKKDGVDIFKSGTKLVVKFNGTLNEKAKLNTEGNENHFKLGFTNNPNTGEKGETEPDDVVVFTYELTPTKVDGTDSTTKLAGAKFKMYKKGEGESKSYAKIDATTKKVTWGNEGDATVFTSGDDGTFKITGIDQGTYYLTETEAPAGYNKLNGDIEVVITSDTQNNQGYTGTIPSAFGKNGLKATVKMPNKDAEKPADLDKIAITNNKGSQLPETGGMGTTALYSVGAVMVAGAAVFYVTSKRMRKED